MQVDVRDPGSIPGSGRSPRGGHGNPLQYSFLENPLDRGAWQDRAWGLKELDMTEMTQQQQHNSNAFAATTTGKG